jgi:hypothetical protein
MEEKDGGGTEGGEVNADGSQAVPSQVQTWW